MVHYEATRAPCARAQAMYWGSDGLGAGALLDFSSFKEFWPPQMGNHLLNGIPGDCISLMLSGLLEI